MKHSLFPLPPFFFLVNATETSKDATRAGKIFRSSFFVFRVFRVILFGLFVFRFSDFWTKNPNKNFLPISAKNAALLSSNNYFSLRIDHFWRIWPQPSTIITCRSALYSQNLLRWALECGGKWVSNRERRLWVWSGRLVKQRKDSIISFFLPLEPF